MNEVNQIKKLMEAIAVDEGIIDGKVSKLEHAKRMGVKNSKDCERVFELLLDDAELSPYYVSLLYDAIDDCIQTRKILATIK